MRDSGITEANGVGSVYRIVEANNIQIISKDLTQSPFRTKV
jgi:hypothetical protein